MRGVRRRAIDSDAELESRRERERVDEESE
jgi:hypothetical protein